MRYTLPFAVLLFTASAASQAMPIYSYESDDFNSDLNQIGNVSTSGGNILTLDTSFDEGTGVFDWNYTTDTSAHNGFWLVVSDGENPKYQYGEYAILYGDIAGGQVSAFEYNGQNASNSYKPPGLSLGFFENAITSSTVAGVTSVNVSIDASAINTTFNTPDWDGVKFGDSLGVWMHPTAGATFAYDTVSGGPGGQLINFTQGSAGYYDTEDNIGFTTTKVPEPASLALLIAGGFGFVTSRRRNKRA